MILTYVFQMIKLSRAHIGIAVLPTFWLGTLFALLLGYDFNLMVFLIGFGIIFLIYASASYTNDYYDFDADQYNRQFGFSGGSGVLQRYPQLKNITKGAGIVFIALALTMTALLSVATFMPWWSVLYIGLGAFFSYFYSAPPFRFSYRGLGEMPHFIAGFMNTGWGYMLITGTIDIPVIIFSIPLSLHLLNVILIFEIPDKEADIHGGKKNFIVNHGRQTSFLVITIIFWFTTLYFTVLSLIGWYADLIDFRLLTALSLIPSFLSLRYYIKKQSKQKQATTQAIHIALSLFTFSIFTLVYFLYLQL
jgi:1,4-dihydroxy-2-naphthoate octaprenyltransferase